MTGLSLRQEIDRHIASNAAALAAARLGELWQKEASPSTAGFVVSRYERLRSCMSLLSHRAFILRSFTIEPVIPLLRGNLHRRFHNSLVRRSANGAFL